MIYRPTVRLISAAILSLTASYAMSGEFVEHNGSALNGYDPLSYFTPSPDPTSGASGLSYTYKDSKFYFLTPGHLRTFASNPEQYAPQFRGYDAYGVSQGLKVPANPRVFKIVNGKLYLFADSEARKNWAKDVQGNVARATEQWAEVVKLAIRNN
ncbi:MAG TPA: YHS domain-containing (seleno)protein [Steroidobacteraceae bacterium]|jgi:YHS domain-containing protein